MFHLKSYSAHLHWSSIHQILSVGPNFAPHLPTAIFQIAALHQLKWIRWRYGPTDSSSLIFHHMLSYIYPLWQTYSVLGIFAGFSLLACVIAAVGIGRLSSSSVSSRQKQAPEKSPSRWGKHILQPPGAKNLIDSNFEQKLLLDNM